MVIHYKINIIELSQEVYELDGGYYTHESVQTDLTIIG